ncbi:twin-arginine translocase TatA/TatE family subunit [Leifsonia sp. H3M29-4]|uniref:twin-arginine translocase TatA/TatE family subunit n=1 Tax=Salinibacterium metalliresistens TaxID=3031321 RepID=UPI0023D9D6C6|nr:twin-arginine translocase TatA/TatE family subunit [Salinibacterium metalliresistens]MDF1477977.1 twin-arginine translocase TatA/TatE family subunit [Salinibacterium metalliresistens]
MMFANMSGWHLLIVVAVIVLLFGATKLPQLARSLGQSTRILRTELRDPKPDDAGEDRTAA